ncbi:hypothetical protein SISSUDRAFT_1120046 [Sistotremastrum suecicum HHB10207 ss-3]|uniref:F-box domain-containing protein n=1 Tax=Sistotremastrum suecicum HHB10207 ss-3 TaxID=1314776 RepID=A0A166CUZ7_9AGAM|nr:hypothetical protein SISSUDRAFT_1120046 [Sistotremastrum suecicum HHB10207 ss-3]
MQFSDLPPELLIMIVDHYMLDPQTFATARQRLRHTLLLGIIDRGLRYFVLLEPRCRFLWSTIHLQWPPGVVDLYLRRSQGRPLSVSLNVGSSHALNSKIDRWSSFLFENMSMIASLDICIRNKQCSVGLAQSLDTPAPLLQSFTLSLGHNVELVKGFFSGFAPKLVSAHINTRQMFNLSCFPTIRVLKMQVDPYAHTPLLPTLAALSQLEELTLIGIRDPSRIDASEYLYIERYPFPQAFPPMQIWLPACRSLTLKNLETPFVHGFLSTIHLSHIQVLAIHETVVRGGYRDSFGWFPPTIAQPFPYIPLNPISPNFIRLILNPDSIYIQTDGTPSYTFSIDLRSLHSLSGDGVEDLQTQIADILLMLTGQLSVRPHELIIVNNAGRGRPERPMSALDEVHFEQLWHHVLPFYGTVETLRLGGNVTAVVEAVCNSQTPLLLPFLSEIEITEKPAICALDGTRLIELLELHRPGPSSSFA